MSPPIQSLNPQLLFTGQCGDAIAFYQRALDAKVERTVRCSEMPGANVPEDRKGWYAHCTLHIDRFGVGWNLHFEAKKA